MSDLQIYLTAFSLIALCGLIFAIYLAGEAYLDHRERQEEEWFKERKRK